MNLQAFTKIFKTIKNKTYRKGDLFAVRGGRYLGEFWVLIQENEGGYDFLSLPDMFRRSAPLEKIHSGINLKIIDYVQNIPRNVFEICKTQYKNGKNSK